MRRFQRLKVRDATSGDERECYLVKYEKQQYQTLRIGTLDYFRKMEGDQVDPWDGKVGGVKLSGPVERMTSEQFARTMRHPNFQIIARDGIALGPTGTVTDDKVRALPNIFVFCCSMEFGVFPDSQRAAHFGASTFSVIDNPGEFARYVAQRLFERAHTHEGQRLTPETYYAVLAHAPVQYVDRHPAPVDHVISDLELFVFQKGKQFSLEQEYRFAWVFFETSSNRQATVQSDPIEIDVPWSTGSCFLPLMEMTKI